jgi:hypothetical protein
MTTKDVLLVVGGVALGYFLSTKKFGQRTSTALGEVVTGVKDTATGLISDVAEVGKDTVKMAECEKEWVEKIGSVARFPSNEAMEQSKATYIKTCMAS